MSDKKIDPEIKKTLAKIGMTASMGVAVITAPFLRKSRLMKNIHAGSATLSLGFALWHHFLYKPGKKSEKNKVLKKSLPENSLSDR